MDAFCNERDLFIEEIHKRTVSLSLKKIEDYYFGMGKAFDDAFNQYARREKKQYAEEKNNLIKDVAENLNKYFVSDDISIETCFNKCIDLAKKILDNDSFGIAQKFVNMSFKHLYCYDDALTDFRDKFCDCHLPLDKYTIKWVRSFKNKEINRELDRIKNAWANLNEQLYNEIQTFVSDKLKENIKYRISHNPSASNNGFCQLPCNKLEAEFIIWHQEKINEIHNILLKTADNDLERLGIMWIVSDVAK